MDFSAIKTLIEQNIRTNNNEDITGSVLQNVLLGIVETLGDSAINDLITALGQEVTNRQNAVQGEAEARSQADNTILGKIANILNGGYLYYGVAGVSTNPGNPTVSCFYFAKGAGTYTNFRNGDNDPIVITDNGLYAFTYEAVENEYWEYNKITDLDDGVFDISRYHASGGTLATYADLSAAIGANGANVPAAFRKGGMSIKYVQSSDNNYVQYLYKKTDAATAATFTNVANWEKMNLAKEVYGNQEERDLTTELTLVDDRAYVNYSTGEIVTYSSYKVYGANVVNMPSIRISCSGPNNSTNKQGLAFYDASGTYIDGYIYERDSNGIREVIVPNGAASVKVSIRDTYTDPIKFYGTVITGGIIGEIEAIEEEIEAINEDIEAFPSTYGNTDNITDPNLDMTQSAINAEVDKDLNGGNGWVDESSSVEWTLGKNVNGRYAYGYNLETNSNQKASDYIPVTPGERVMITIPAVLGARNWWGIGYYDANKDAVDCGVTRIQEGGVSANTPRDITIPEGVYFIRTTSWIDENTYGPFVFKRWGFVNGLMQRVLALEEGEDTAVKKYAGLKCVAIGDSHTAQRSVWLKPITDKTGMVHLSELNNLIYFANTTPASYEMYVNPLLAQAQALVDEAPNYDDPDVIFIEEVHQRWNDTLSAKPFIPHNMVDLGYTKNNLREEYEYFDENAATLLGAIASAARNEGTVLRSSAVTSQIVATFSASSVSAGTITITIGGVAHVFSITSGMTVKQVVDLVSLQDFGDDSDWDNTGKSDTTITFSWIGAGTATNNFVIDTGNTGITITMGSISTTTKYVYRRYNQYDLADWTDKTKWDSFGAWNGDIHNDNATYGYWTNAYAAMGGVITLLQTNFPKAMIVWMALPNWGLPSAFNPAPRNEAELKASSVWVYDKTSRDKFIEVGELYNLRCLDVELISEICINNYDTFFTRGNVHPKEDGYKQWGDTIANWL